MHLRQLSLVILGLAFLAAPALAIDLGDEAPPLKVEKWLKGGPIDLKEGKGKSIYVVEFWATWCGPCRTSIPHLTELQKKYKDKGVVAVGISIDEAKVRKTRKDVEPFVKEMGDKMGYAVALDTEDGAMDKAYMEAFLVGGIPNAFVVDKSGRIVWQGHPMELDQVLEDVIAGKFDLEAAKKADRERRKEAEKDAEIGKLFERYFELVGSGKTPEGADKLGREVMKGIEGNAQALNFFAWNILTNEAVQYRDLKLALEAGKAANDASKGKDPAIVDTYARALFDNGMVKEAIEQQKKAIELAGDDKEMKADLEKTLKRYEAAAKK